MVRPAVPRCFEGDYMNPVIIHHLRAAKRLHATGTFLCICLLGLAPVCGVASAQSCGSQQSAVNELKLKIDRDKRAIRSLGFNTDAAEFDALANASEEQRIQMAHTAFKNLVENLAQAALEKIGSAASAALSSQKGLPNGYASLNPWNVNARIGELDNPNGPMAAMLRQIAGTREKAAKLRVLEGLPDAVEREIGGYDLLFGEASTEPGSLIAYLKLTKALADLGGQSAISAVLDIGTSGGEVVVAYADLIDGNLDTLEKLNQLSAANARALANYDATMKAHIQSLRTAKFQLDACEAKPGNASIEGSWTVINSTNSCGAGGPAGYTILRRAPNSFVFATDQTGSAPIAGTGPGRYAMHFHQPETDTNDGWNMDLAFTAVGSDTLQVDGQSQILSAQAENHPGPCILHFTLRRNR